MAAINTSPAKLVASTTPVPAKHMRRRIGFIRERLRDLRAERIRLDEELKSLKDQLGIKEK